ncbi:hypothetical protein MSWH1_0666 [Methanosarcina sp. WH1]|nr:hypothetical protein MSWH1_0666 [Methanosarcina sp. WH1]
MIGKKGKEKKVLSFLCACYSKNFICVLFKACIFSYHRKLWTIPWRIPPDLIIRLTRKKIFNPTTRKTAILFEILPGDP